MNSWAHKKGFTLIELIVTIAVIGILATIMIVSYTGIQQRSRDSDRSSDVTQLKIAIEKYHAEKSTYPRTCGTSGCAVSMLANDLAPYLKTIPHDPRNTADSSGDYQYVALADGDGYAIRVQYEAKDVCKTGENVNMTWWSSIPLC